MSKIAHHQSEMMRLFEAGRFASAKDCTKCGETKPTTEFNKDSRRGDGLQSHCRLCHKTFNANRYLANQEKLRAASAKWRAENPEKHRASKAKWEAANAERIKANKAKYHATNKEKLKEANAKWHAANPDARRIREQNRRARKRASGGKLSKGLADRLFSLQHGKCACGCGQPLGDDFHLDHIMPLALGGTNTDDNIQLLRSRCNIQKKDKHPVDFMQSKGFLL